MNDEPLDTFCYCNQLTGNSFRLLKLILDHDEAPLACEMKEQEMISSTVSLSPYDALSYTWNDEARTEKLICNGDVMFITKNLYRALWRLRQSRQIRYLWVDAICINQADSIEKTAQVRKMIHIYSKSRKTIAWLGEEKEGIESVKRLMFTIYELAAGPQHLLQDTGIDLDVHRYGLPAITDPVWLDLFDLLTRPWFHRIWIVQEFVTSPGTTFVCGRHQLQTPVIFVAGQVLNKFQNVQDVFQTSTRVRNGTFGLRVTIPLLEQIGRSYWNRSKPLDLTYLLRLTRTFQSSDPRDKIFALIGICRDSSLDLIDYDRDVRSINIEVMRQALTKANGVDILDLVSAYRAVERLPSWVPEFTSPFMPYTPMLTLYTDSEFRTLSSNDCYSEDDKVVYITGAIVDSVKIVTDTPQFFHNLKDFEDTTAVYQTGRKIYNWIQQCESVARLESAYIDGSPTTEALWRALILDTDYLGRHNALDQCSSYEAWRGMVQTIAGDGFTPEERNIVELRILGLGIDRDAVLSTVRTIWSAVYLGTCAWRGRMPTGLSGWIRAAGLLCFSIVACDLMLMACPVVIRDEDEVGRGLQKRLNQLSQASRAAENAIAKFASGRNFFFSESKVMGWAPANAEVEDKICVFKGSRIPFVIREHGDGFKIVGDCYLQGLMQGEMWNFYRCAMQEIKLL